MNLKRFYTPSPAVDHSRITQNGFTLVEIAIVMIIIGLLIGGIFSGMKLIDNANAQKTVQDIKAIESAALTFKDTYRGLPGDIRNPNTRIPNCTVAPCATGGNGDRVLDAGLASHYSAINATNERFTFWSHLQAADLLSNNVKNTTDMEFGEGQPDSPIGSGYRMTSYTGPVIAGCDTRIVGGVITITSDAFAAYGTTPSLSCVALASVDAKMDDGLPLTGRVTVFGDSTCTMAPVACGVAYNRTATPGYTFGYDAAF